MDTNESVMEQIYDKLNAYIEKLINGLSNASLQPKDIPLENLCSIIYTHFVSDDSILDTTTAFQDSITSLLTLLEKSMNEGNEMNCVSLLKTLSQSLKFFVLQEKCKALQSYYFNQKKSFTAYAHMQYDRHMSVLNPSSDNLFSGRGVVYTAITGGYDHLHDPAFVDPSLDYVCFTDSSTIKSNVWQIKQIENPNNLDNIRLARRHKIMCTEYVGEYDYSIWVDGKVQIIGDLKELIHTYHKGSPLLCFPHFVRDCIYDEANACVNAKKGNFLEIEKQVAQYKNSGYPAHNGLIDSCILFRSHHANALEKLMSAWWNEVQTQSTRDQLSFNYVCYTQGFNYDLCNLYSEDNPYTQVRSHLL